MSSLTADDRALSPLKRALIAIRELKDRVAQLEASGGADLHAPIAIVGVGARFPGGASGPGGMWDVLARGVDATGDVPTSRWDAAAWSRDGLGPSRGAFLEDLARFDAGFFGISPREAAEMDPAQRALLEVAWEALEDAAIPPLGLGGSRTAVTVGIGLSDYGRRHFLGADPGRLTPWSGTGSLLSVAAGRIAYALDLRGPALAVDTACSSSLVAAHLGVGALRTGQADLALVAGVNVMLSPMPGAYFARLQALSSDGRCRAFDASADGYGRGEGVGVLVLKRLADALRDGDPVRAVIRGSAVGQDGRSNGLTAPSGAAQQAVVRAALADGGLSPADVGAVEAHGTGTPLGDPIEIEALRGVFGGHTPLRIGSVKTNLGHTETAAGIAGLIKATLSLEHGELPRHLHLRTLNPRIRLDDVGFEVVTEHTPWPDGLPRRMGVSGFGLSGTNAHLVLEPAPAPAAPDPPVDGPHLLVLSARSEAALARLGESVGRQLADVDLADAASTLAHGRSPLPWRLAVAVRGPEDAPRFVDAPRRRADGGKLAWLFTGQGAQWARMGADLHAAGGVFREVVDRVIDAVDLPLREVWLGGDPRIHDTAFTQVATYAVQCGLAARLAELGVEPVGLLGHSVGELAAAHVAGVFTLEDGARLVAARGRLMGALPAGGAMAAVFVAPASLGPLPPGVELAAINHPGQVVVSGDRDAVDALCVELGRQGIDSRPLQVSHAFHSAHIEPMLARYRDVVATIPLSPPRGRLVSALDGELLGRRAVDPDLWVRQARETVRFADGLLALSDCALFLELGPAPVLTAAGARTLPEARFVPTLTPDGDGPREVLEAVGQLWAAGVPVSAAPARRRRRAELPSMPWQGERHWVDVPVTPLGGRADALHQVAWVPEAPPRTPPALRGTWWVLAHGESDVERVLRGRGCRVVRAVPGTGFDARGDVVTVDPGDRAHFEWLRAHTGRPDGVIVLWALQEPVRSRDGLLGVAFASGVAEAPVSAVVPADRPSGVPGLVRVLRAERPSDAGALVHVDGQVPAEAVLAEVAARSPEVRLGGERRVPRLRPSPPAEAPPLGRTVWITGGNGDLGLQLARRLAGSVDALVLVSRTGVPERELLRLGPHVRSVQGDVTDNLVPLAAEVPPDVVFHLAGARVDGTIEGLGPDELERALHARVDGAWRLNEVAPDAELVLVGSAAGLLGNPGQAAYASANAWLEGFARWRAAQGAPTWCVAPGPIAGTAMTADVLERLEALGARALSLRESVDLVLAARGSAEPVVLAAPFDWARWARAVPSPLLVDLVPRDGEPSGAPPSPLPPDEVVDGALRAVLGAVPPSGQGFFDAGMDSLMATELRVRLEGALGRTLPASVAFDHPTRDALIAFVGGDPVLVEPSPGGRADGPIAVVGLACRLPGGVEGPEGFWELLSSGRDGVRVIDRWDVDATWSPEPATPGRHVTRHAALLDDVAGFDAERFGISPREAASLDPQQRLLLEAAWNALEHAGHPPGGGLADTGVFVGIGASEYGRRFDPLDPTGPPDPYSGTGNEGSFAAGRLAHALGFQGPALAVNTACSSSLVAVHLAVRALREGACSMALAGGANAIVDPAVTVQLSQIRALAPDGRCKTFDASADGYGRGEGVALVVLKRLEDARADGDRIWAVVRGSAVNHDGRAAGLTVPNGSAQRAVIAAALADAGVDGADVGMLEAHGTGTRLGDPIEIEAARAVLSPGRSADRPLYVGSAKTNVGHLEAGAGAVGLVKAILALVHRAVPPTLHLETPNPELDLDGLVLPSVLTPWDGGLAGVSSFGISGTNAHVVLERGPDPSAPVAEVRSHQLLVAGELSGAAVEHALAAPFPVDGVVARSIATSRAHGPVRGFRVVPDGPVGPPERPVSGLRAWLFTGQGAQWVGMGRDLLGVEPVYTEAFEACAQVLAEQGVDLHGVIGDERVHHTRWTQPATFAVGWSLARWLRSRGHEPDLVLGHSLGEWTAAAVAGAVSWEDALRLVALRGSLMGDLPDGGGSVAVFCGPEQAREAIGDAPVDVAGLNGPGETVLSGPWDALDAVLERLGVAHHRLRTSHAFHSRAMDPVIEPFREAVARVRFEIPRIPLITNADGRAAGERVLDPGHWASLIRRPVCFADGVRTLVERGATVFVEVGPRPVLLGMAARTASVRGVPTLQRDEPGVPHLLAAVGRLWQAGDEPDWDVVTGVSGPSVPPPPHPFLRVRHWVERAESVGIPTGWCWDASWEPAVLAPATASGTVEGDGALAESLRDALPEGPARLWAGGLDGALQSAQRAVADGVRWGVVCRDQPALAGFARSFALECPDQWGGLVHAPAGSPVDAVLQAWAARGHEDEVRVGPDGRTEVRRLRASAPETLPPVRGAWLVTGATGAIGRAVVRRLLVLGATEVIAVSRDPGEPDDVRVRPLALDVGDPGATDALRSLSVRGVVHCAGAGRRVALDRETEEGLADVRRARVAGARALDEAFPELDAFLAVGSIAGAWGSAGQVAYAASMTELEAVVAARSARGQLARVVALGPVRGGITDADGVDWLGSRGLRAMSPAQAAEAVLRVDGICADVDWSRLGAVLRARGPRPLLDGVSPSTVPSASLDRSPGPEDLRDLVHRAAARVLELPAEDLDPRQGLFDAGMDSLTAVELASALSRALGRALPATLVFEHGSVEGLAEALGGPGIGAVASRSAVAGPVAIVGMACRFPGGVSSPEGFWAFLRSGADAVGPVPSSRWDASELPDAPALAAFLDDIEGFDPFAFGMSPREAAALDPQQRLFLEVCSEALERAGIGRPRGRSVGVFCGIPGSSYLDRFERPGGEKYPDELAGTGNESSFAAGRVAYALGLVGPAVSLNTACSSSLVAMHLACEALRAGDCELALAGGVSLMVSPGDHAYLARLGALSPSGRSLAFSAEADGYGRGEGAGAVLLAPLEHAERAGLPILAIVEGSAVNHDGASGGLTVPNGTAQERVIADALRRAGRTAEQIGWIETHGTGTRLGDPIEVRAIQRALGPRGPVWAGSVKTRVGHLEQAAGMASVLRVVLQQRHGELAPDHTTGHPSPELPPDVVRIPSSPTPWEGSRVAGVSGFGLSGTNAHLVIGPGRPLPEVSRRDGASPLFLGASGPRALDILERDARVALEAHGPAVADVLWARARRPVRRVVRDGAVVADGTARRRPDVVFLFTGQGAQRPDMHRMLLADPVWSGAFEEVLRLAEPHRDIPLAEVLGDDRVHLTQHAQVALFAMEWATASWWSARGVQARAVAGHSVGELAAAAWAGMLPLDAAVELVCARGRLMGALPRGGTMAAVFAGEDRVRAALVPGAEVAGVNHPEETVISGTEQAVRAVLDVLPEEIGRRVLSVSHAFHSAAMEPALEAYREVVERLPWGPGRIPLARGLDGVLSDAPPAPELWVRQLREPVRFLDAVRSLGEHGATTWLEVGPAPVLVGAVARALPGATVVSSFGRDPSPTDLLDAVARLWVDGVEPVLDGILDPAPGFVPVPPTPFERVRCWLDLPERGAGPPVEDALLEVVWRPVPGGVGPGDAALLDVPAIPDPSAWERVLDGIGADLRRLGEAGRSAVLLSVGLCLREGDPPAGALGAGLAGFVRSARAEGVRVCLVDRSADVPRDRALAAADPDEAVVSVRSDGRHVQRLARCPLPPASPELRSGRAWVVTGGFGALGVEVAVWLASRGVEEIVLVGRTLRPEAVARVEAAGAIVRAAAVDVGDPDAMEGALGLAERAIAGVVHAAGVLDDGPLEGLTRERLSAVSRPKLRGALVLREALRDADLDAFVLFSSASAVMGSAGQVAYAAANGALLGLARAWRAEGVPVTCVAWGPWGEVGMAAQLPETVRSAQREQGIRTISVRRGLEALERALAAGPGDRVVLPMDWGTWGRMHGDPIASDLGGGPSASTVAAVPRGRGIVAAPSDPDAVVEQAVRTVLRWPVDRPLDPQIPLSDVGLDSLMAVQLRNALSDAGISLPVARLLGGPSIDQVRAMARAAVTPAEPVEPLAAASHAAPDPWLRPEVTHALVAVFALAIGGVLTWTALRLAEGPEPVAVEQDARPPRADR